MSYIEMDDNKELVEKLEDFFNNPDAEGMLFFWSKSGNFSNRTVRGLIGPEVLGMLNVFQQEFYQDKVKE